MKALLVLAYVAVLYLGWSLGKRSVVEGRHRIPEIALLCALALALTLTFQAL